MKTLSAVSLMTLATLSLSGCGGSDGALEAKTVLEYDQCQSLDAGLTRVSYQQVADIRGSRLIRLETTAQDPPGESAPGERTSPQRNEPNGDQPAGGNRGLETAPTEEEEEEEDGAEDGSLLVAISRGPQPTPGYGLSLEAAHRSGATAVVEVSWRTPAADAVLAQVMTHPCLVVALPEAGFERVEARTVNGETLGTLSLQEDVSR